MCAPADQRDILARAIHERYRQNQQGVKPPDDPAMQPWETLAEHLRASNRQQADAIGATLQRIGCGVRPAAGHSPAPFVFTRRGSGDHGQRRPRPLGGGTASRGLGLRPGARRCAQDHAIPRCVVCGSAGRGQRVGPSGRASDSRGVGGSRVGSVPARVDNPIASWQLAARGGRHEKRRVQSPARLVVRPDQQVPGNAPPVPAICRDLAPGSGSSRQTACAPGHRANPAQDHRQLRREDPAQMAGAQRSDQSIHRSMRWTRDHLHPAGGQGGLRLHFAALRDRLG